jgi:hypothetical protein
MRRYERQHINEVWYGDTSAAFSLTVDGKKKKTWIVAFIDDRSRFVVGADVFFNDTFVNVMSVMKPAVRRFGRPKLFTFDNGSSYKNGQMDLLMARIGSVSHYCAPYTPESKAKLERWFKTMKSQWLAVHKPADFKSLEEMRASLAEYVHRYNNTRHSSLGDSPQNVFFKESAHIRRLPEEILEKAFLLELERRVSIDGVVRIDKTDYEVPYRYAKQKITLRYSADLSSVYVVDPHTSDLEPLRLLKKTENAHVKREAFKFGEGES